MINKLKLALEQGSGTIEIPNDEAAKIFKVLLAVSGMLDGSEESITNPFKTIVPTWLYEPVQKAWGEMTA